MKDKGYKPFIEDETMKAKIKEMILDARVKMGDINENCAKKIAELIIEGMTE
jgi:hypothetical protein